MRLMLSMSFKTQLLLISKYNQYIAICIIYFPLMNLKNNIKSKQMQTVRHNPDKDSCFLANLRLGIECSVDQFCRRMNSKFKLRLLKIKILRMKKKS